MNLNKKLITLIMIMFPVLVSAQGYGDLDINDIAREYGASVDEDGVSYNRNGLNASAGDDGTKVDTKQNNFGSGEDGVEVDGDLKARANSSGAVNTNVAGNSMSASNEGVSITNSNGAMGVNEGGVYLDFEGEKIHVGKNGLILNDLNLSSDKEVENFAKTILSNNSVATDVDIQEDSVSVTYPMQGKFLGLFSMDFDATVEIDTDDNKVDVDKPWYTFLVFGDDTSTLEKEITDSVSSIVADSVYMKKASLVNIIVNALAETSDDE